MNSIAVCLTKCPKVQPPPYAGRCDCLYDPANPVTIQNREKTGCPLGLFPGSAGLNVDPAAIEAELAAQGYDPQRDYKGGDCGCAGAAEPRE